MSDRTDAFLSQVTTFLDNDFTGEIVLQCQNGQINEMQLRQRIRVTEQTARSSALLLQDSSTLTAVVGRP